MKICTKRIFVILLIIMLTLTGILLNENTNVFASTKKVSKVLNFKVVKYSNIKVKLSWSKAKNATKYQIYRKSGKKGYKLIKTTKSKFFTILC